MAQNISFVATNTLAMLVLLCTNMHSLLMVGHTCKLRVFNCGTFRQSDRWHDGIVDAVFSGYGGDV